MDNLFEILEDGTMLASTVDSLLSSIFEVVIISANNLEELND
jgi:hypothetical protein